MKINKKSKKNLKKKEEWESFDDCAICQAMKSGATNTKNDLEKAFDEQDFKSSVMTMRVQNKNDLYYDAMELLNVDDFESAKKLLLKAKDMDLEYVQTYVGLVSAHAQRVDKDKREEYIKIGFEKVKKIFPSWPKQMEWGMLENRAYMRAIQYMADMYWDNNELDNAEELFRLLLRLNPNDNQGVRYEIAGMFAGINGPKLNKMFDEGNKKQNWSKLEKMVKEQNKIHKFWKEPRC
jgi:tetratricopeptide (TPR) repeat protein